MSTKASLTYKNDLITPIAKQSPKTLRVGHFLISFIGLLFLWQLIIWVFDIPAFILPSPQAVLDRLILRYPVLMSHTWVTMQEIILGLLLGLFSGISFALILHFSKQLQAWLLPLLIVSQAVPTFAIAPILMLWLGYGITSKIFMSAMVIFFPITMCCFDGLKQTPQAYLDLAKTMGASRLDILWKIRLPAAMPALASGIRVAVVIAPIGAVVGEWVGSSEGLGYLMLQANARMMVDEMFAALFVLACLSVSLYFLTDRLLRKWIFWH